MTTPWEPPPGPEGFTPKDLGRRSDDDRSVSTFAWVTLVIGALDLATSVCPLIPLHSVALLMAVWMFWGFLTVGAALVGILDIRTRGRKGYPLIGVGLGLAVLAPTIGWFLLLALGAMDIYPLQ